MCIFKEGMLILDLNLVFRENLVEKFYEFLDIFYRYYRIMFNGSNYIYICINFVLWNW